MLQSFNKKLITGVLLLSTFTSLAFKFEDDVINYFGISKDITFSNLVYKLAWSSHPNLQYYKQEYVPDGENVNRFHNMVLVDFIQRDIPVMDVVASQVNVLEKRKKTDINCRYALVNNKDSSEYILDFMMSEVSGSNINILEWNAYHYKIYTDKAGHKGVLLFGVSHRAYNEEAAPFLTELDEYRDKHRKALIKFPLPQIQLK